MRARRERQEADVNLTLEEAAARLGNDIGERFVRRLIAERRIRFVKVGRFVRIPDSAVSEFIAANTVPARPRGRRAA